MKTNALLAFFFFFLVALFASTRAAFVRDSDGHLVANGGTYYLLPQDFTRAAIVGTNITNPDGSCSVAVVEKLTHSEGNATLIETKFVASYITTDYPLQISFNPLPSDLCTKNPEWLVVWDEDFGQNAVMVGYDSDFPQAVSGRFYFRIHESARYQYILVFRNDNDKCGPHPVGVKTDRNNNRRLIVAADQEPLVFKLVKISGVHVASHISMVV